MNILEVKDLCKTYIVNKRQNNVLKNVSFTVSEGEMAAVMGDCAIIGLNRKNLTKSGFLRHSPISLTRKR